MTTKAKGTSVRQKLINLSIESGIPFQNLETAFILERLVARLTADADLQKHLVFKGGFVGLKVYNSDRYTVDVDALVVKSDVESILERAKRSAETDLDDGVWFRFENQMDLATQGEYGGIRQTYRAGIGEALKNLNKAQVVNFDVGIGDPVTPEPISIETDSLIIPNSNLSWQVYPVETIIAEKMHALIAHGDINSRSKDVYDLAILLPMANSAILAEALKRCFEFRQTELPNNFANVLKSMDTKSLERGWRSATVSVSDKPQFKMTFETIVRLVGEVERPFQG
ncbi:MAG: nucleotidyl transferase AbiEii/AbiGii toxin family protein [Pyrinomonadaceae bacterium]|jgi:predicted nucleotidyltransferase component of viral defense system